MYPNYLQPLNILIKELFRNTEDLPFRITFAKPVSEQNRPAVFRCIRVKLRLNTEQPVFQLEKRTERQAFHENMDLETFVCFLKESAENRFRQINIETDMENISILSGKKEHLTIIRKKKKPESIYIEPDTAQAFSHNRQKKYIIQEGKPVGFLVKLGVMTSEGKVIASCYDKFRQINRFLEYIDDILDSIIPSDEKTLSIIDFGCGKSYLTFAVYYFLTELRGIHADITGLDLKAEVICFCNKLAQEFGYTSLRFKHGDIAGYTQETAPDMVISLHACDTATDYAIAQAIKWKTKAILSVPCCQHEISLKFRKEKRAKPELTVLLKYGIITERFAALATDAMRAELLEAAGYKVQVLEFIDMSHTPKNLLIRAVLVPGKKNIKIPKAYTELKNLIGAAPCLENLIFPKQNQKTSQEE